MRKTILLVAMAALTGLAGCGSSETPADAAAQKAKAAPKAKTGAVPVDATIADMTPAVTVTKGPSSVDLRFEVLAKPQPGQPLEVDLALIPKSPTLERVTVKFDGDNGLDLVKGADPIAVDKPAPGVTIRRTVTVLPKADGIYTLIAIVTAASDGDSRTTTYSVPVICGAGLPELPTKTSAATSTAAKSR